MLTYLIASAVFFFLLTFMWGTSSWVNIIIKGTLFFLGSYGAFLALQMLGYIVKV